jgi:hypothetical protein
MAAEAAEQMNPENLSTILVRSLLPDIAGFGAFTKDLLCRLPNR